MSRLYSTWLPRSAPFRVRPPDSPSASADSALEGHSPAPPTSSVRRPDCRSPCSSRPSRPAPLPRDDLRHRRIRESIDDARRGCTTLTRGTARSSSGACAAMRRRRWRPPPPERDRGAARRRAMRSPTFCGVVEVVRALRPSQSAPRTEGVRDEAVWWDAVREEPARRARLRARPSPDALAGLRAEVRERALRSVGPWLPDDASAGRPHGGDHRRFRLAVQVSRAPPRDCSSYKVARFVETVRPRLGGAAAAVVDPLCSAQRPRRRSPSTPPHPRWHEDRLNDHPLLGPGRRRYERHDPWDPAAPERTSIYGRSSSTCGTARRSGWSPALARSRRPGRRVSITCRPRRRESAASSSWTSASRTSGCAQRRRPRGCSGRCWVHGVPTGSS